MKDYTGQHIGILGCGASGVAAARLCLSLGARVTVLDSGSGEALEARAAGLCASGCEVLLGEHVAAPDGVAFAISSPGIDPAWPIARLFFDKGIPVISELEFGARCADLPIVAVTGTNGKTTVTELVAAVLNAGGQRTIACGNHGKPLCEIIGEGSVVDIHTVEVSSFQLELIETFRPSVSVWMNFAPDHLDRHPSVEAYYAAKCRVFENQNQGDTAVVRAGEKLPVLKAETLTFDAFGEDADFTLDGTQIYFRKEAVLDLSSTNLRGCHNAENAMAALAVGHARGIGFGAMEGAIAAYTPPPHRCELVGTWGGVDFVNDSKATNLHALESALRSLDGKVVLIAGGKEKGLDYRPLAPLVAERATSVFTIGEIGGDLCDVWGGAVSCTPCAGLDEAVGAAAHAAARGQTVLFSPGTSSFDMFDGYAVRGQAFREAVSKIF